MMVREALNSALDEEMSADPKVFLMGEEVKMRITGMLFLFLVICFHNFCSYVLLFHIECRLGNIRAHIRSQILTRDR